MLRHARNASFMRVACLCDRHVQKSVELKCNAGSRAAGEAEAWLASDQGHALWRAEVKRLWAESREGGEGAKRLTRLEVEYRARQALLKARAKAEGEAGSEGGGAGGGAGGGGGSEGKAGGGGGAQAQAQAEMDKAEELLLRAWEIHESCLGREHPSTAAACLSLGNLCAVNKDLPQAKLWFDSSVAILDTCFAGVCTQVDGIGEGGVPLRWRGP